MWKEKRKGIKEARMRRMGDVRSMNERGRNNKMSRMSDVKTTKERMFNEKKWMESLE